MWVGFGFPKGVSISLCSNQLQKAPLKSGDLQLLLSLQNSICNDLRINMESLEEHFHQKKKKGVAKPTWRVEEVRTPCGSDVNGSLQCKNHVEKCSYLLLWIREKGRNIFNRWALIKK